MKKIKNSQNKSWNWIFLFRNCFKNEGMDWIEFESMNVARAYCTLTTLGDKILAAGGYTGQGYVLCLFLFVL